MRAMLTHSLVWGAFFVSGLIVSTRPSAAANCALYARAETGAALFGDAGGWWDQANGRYQRGQAPAVGAILVFKRTQRIPSGHVAVVAKVISANEILVDHANWHRGRVNRGMSVIDTSPSHDWTSVAVLDLPSGKYGRDYPTYGFVYPGASPREIVEARDNGQHDAHVVDGWESLEFSAQPALLHVAFATEGNQHRKEATRHLGRQASTARVHRHGISHTKRVSPYRASQAIAPAAHAPEAHTALTRSPTPAGKTVEVEHHRA
jgi:surface antigen